MYKYDDIPQMQQRVENIDDQLTLDVNKTDFFRVGVAVYVGTFPDVSGPDFVIDPRDAEGIEIFKTFCQRMAEHYKHLNKKS